MSEKSKTAGTKSTKKTEETTEKTVKKTKTTAKKTPAETTSKKTTAKDQAEKTKAAKKTEAEKPKTAKKTTAAKESTEGEKPKTPRKIASTKTEVEKPKTTRKVAEKKETKVSKKVVAAAAAEAKPKVKRKKAVEAAAAKPSKKIKPEKPAEGAVVDSRLMRVARRMKKRQPAFRHEQAHRWVRAPESWRKIRGNDSNMRRMKSGHAPLVNPGYRKPVVTRHIHPSGYHEVLVYRPSDVEGLDPHLHVIRIGGTVGARKKQDIIKRAEAIELRIVNPGAPESAVGEGDLFSELEGLEDLEADEK